MKWNMFFASDVCGAKSRKITINTLEDLQALAKKYKQRLIVDFEEYEIIVYDYYVE